jgi:hypothetical protein
MPPKLSARQLFWTGVVLTAAGVFIGRYLMGIVFALWGQGAITTGPLPSITSALEPLLVPCGVVVLACSLIARTIESQATPASHLRTSGRSMPPRLTAKQILWTGVVLVVLGLILGASMDDLYVNLSGSSDLSANLARDLLNFIGVPLRAVMIPLGIALLPSALIVRMLEPGPRDQRVSSEPELSRR